MSDLPANASSRTLASGRIWGSWMANSFGKTCSAPPAWWGINMPSTSMWVLSSFPLGFIYTMKHHLTLWSQRSETFLISFSLGCVYLYVYTCSCVWENYGNHRNYCNWKIEKLNTKCQMKFSEVLPLTNKDKIPSEVFRPVFILWLLTDPSKSTWSPFSPASLLQRKKN